MFSWLGRLFPRRSLDRVRGRTHVRVHGVVAPGPEVASPVGDRRVPVLGWFFSERFTATSQGAAPVHLQALGALSEHPERDAYRSPIARGLFVPEHVMVDVDGRIVRVVGAGLTAQLASGTWEGEILNVLPPRLAHVLVNVDDPNLRYGERWLDVGDTVILRAEVAPVRDEGRAPYRGGEGPPRADFETVGPATLIDTIGRQLRVRADAVSPG